MVHNLLFFLFRLLKLFITDFSFVLYLCRTVVETVLCKYFYIKEGKKR